MEEVIKDLESVINVFSEKLTALEDFGFSAKPTQTKWSKKEVLGHLADSAQNNLRRFIVGQYENLPKIFYEQDFWVTANGYQHMAKNEVILLWRLLNERIIIVLKNTPSNHFSKMCDTGKEEVTPRSIGWLAADYVKHLKHHLNQIIPGSFDVVYP